MSDYKALRFMDAVNAYLASYIRSVTSTLPSRSRAAPNPSAIPSLPRTLPVWHRLKLLNYDVQGQDFLADRPDAVIATPKRQATGGEHAGMVAERFDTVLIDEKGEAFETGIAGQSITLQPIPRLTDHTFYEVYVSLKSE